MEEQGCPVAPAGRWVRAAKVLTALWSHRSGNAVPELLPKPLCGPAGHCPQRPFPWLSPWVPSCPRCSTLFLTVNQTVTPSSPWG